MSQFLPFGIKLSPTPEQIEQQNRKFRTFEYYGIPYGIFDGSDKGEGHKTQRDKDIELARILIIKGESLPKDLEQRLLQYKQSKPNQVK